MTLIKLGGEATKSRFLMGLSVYLSTIRVSPSRRIFDFEVIWNMDRTHTIIKFSIFYLDALYTVHAGKLRADYGILCNVPTRIEYIAFTFIQQPPRHLYEAVHANDGRIRLQHTLPYRQDLRFPPCIHSQPDCSILED